MSSLIPSNINIENIIVEYNDTSNDTIIECDNSINDINNFNINYAQLETLSLNNLLNLSNLPETKKGVSLCLNMIVRNESKIITRLLTSVLPIIDTYVICDTGSTDDTVSIIKDFFNSIS